jgi:sulfite exporter TauE/SafE/copper chaperone CopZ
METTVKKGLQKHSFRISGMFCVNCKKIIEKELKNTEGIQSATVNYKTGFAVVTCDDAIIGFDKISAIIENLGYKTLERDSKNQDLQIKTLVQIVGTLVIILALFVLLRAFGTSKLVAAFPLAKEGMGYGMLLVIGLLTSVHCVAMCGGINLSQTLRDSGESAPADKYSLLLPSILYNGGRLVAYTLAGVLVGALGSVITLSGYFKGLVQLVAGIFMLIMGINMLGLFPSLRRFIPQIPNIFAKKIDEQKTGRSPLVVGFLNGFIPCGPLQAMQLYALSTGSPVKGGVAMFLFCAGTIPLMFTLGAASSALSNATSGAKGRIFSRRIMYAGAILVATLGLVMFSNGLSLSGFTNLLGKPVSATESTPLSRRQVQSDTEMPDINSPSSPPEAAQNDLQIVNSVLRSNRYPAITVEQGVPVQWTIDAPPSSITGCNNRMIINEYGIQHTFKQGDNVIEFTPEKTGRFLYSCWMGMIKSTITVVASAGKGVGQ